MINEKELDNIAERAFAIGIQVGVIHLSTQLGIIEDRLTERQAWKIYGKRQVEDWRRKRWIVGYPTGNKSIRKFYYKRSELETAQRMLDFQNIIPSNKLKQYIESNGIPQIKK